MNVICRFPSQGPTLQEQLLQLLLARERRDGTQWQSKK